MDVDDPEYAKLDPRFEWIEIQNFSDPAPWFIKGGCKHLDLERVTLLVTGEHIGHLCKTCEAALPPEYAPDPFEVDVWLEWKAAQEESA